MTTVRDFYEYLNGIAPFDTQEDWDNSGMLVGDMDAEVTKAAVALDIIPETVRQAKALGAELIISHHPVIFKGIKSVTKGSVPFELAANGISAVCCHTPLDIAHGGTNDTVARIIGLDAYVDGDPILRFADIPETSAQSLAKKIGEALCADVRYADAGKSIKKVALCTGSGCSLIEASGDADAFITGDASHHDFIDALQKGITLIAAGHFETENPIVPVLCKKLSERFGDVEIIDLKQENPVKYI